MISDQQYQDLQFLVNSGGWQLVSDYIKRQIEICLSDLECRNFGNLAEAVLIQGKLRAFRTILGYPGTRIEGYKNKNFKEEK